MTAVSTAVRLVRAIQNAWAARFQFLVAFLGVLFVTLTVLIWLDWIPDAPVTTTPAPTTISQIVAPDVSSAFVSPTGENPVKIAIPAISLSATISNPDTTDVETLDQYLLTGAVRYPTSAHLGQDNGNVILFGHSSYLPIVHNQAYKTFDGIQNLAAGDLITVSSSDRVYTYAVDTVQKESADSGAIPLTVTGQHLTLATCNSFATKSDRFVVSATLVESHAISS